MSADSELASILNRRQQINEGDETVQPRFKVVNVYTEFHELSRKQIKEYQNTFNRWIKGRKQEMEGERTNQTKPRSY